MSSDLLPSKFGLPEYYGEFAVDVRVGLVVIKRWQWRRWVVIYYRVHGEWELSSCYTVCRPVGPLGWIVQEHAPQLYYGASVDSDGSYVVIEGEIGVWVMFYDLDIDRCCLLDTAVLPSLNMVGTNAFQYARYTEYPAVVALQEMLLPLMLSIGEVNLVDTLIETVAYVVEYFGTRRCSIDIVG
jgi:hypothetical protein